MLTSNLADLLAQTVDAVTHAGELLVAEWGRVGGPRGEGDKAEVDMEIEAVAKLHSTCPPVCIRLGQHAS
jgi:hypothetical protein